MQRLSSSREKPASASGWRAAVGCRAFAGLTRTGLRVAALTAWIGVTSLTVTCHADARIGVRLPPPPDQLYGALFVAVQTTQVFDDQKTFVDAVPNMEPAAIVALYEQQKDLPGFDLKGFVLANFTLPSDQGITPPPHQSLREHIDWLWPALVRTTATAPANSSLIPLPRPYVVPGGHFREGYYWDTYFTMLGLAEAGLTDLIDDMLQNFAYELDQLGHIPNGNRTYYLSRSQPPFFSHRVELRAQTLGEDAYRTYLPALQQEYAYWMRDMERTPPGDAQRHVVVLRDGTVLNRYWDELDTPRAESYSEDVQTAQKAPARPAPDVYRDLRAAAESGWDFSSRWFGDNSTLATIRTTAIIPIDLNSLLFHLEQTIAKGCALQQDVRCVMEFTEHAAKRRVAIEKYLWNAHGYYGDYDWQLDQPRDNPSAAMLYPLFVGVPLPERARATARIVKTALLKPGGLVTTTYPTGQQWDAPNGWAPLHWIAVAGLRRYHRPTLAQQIGTRFLAEVEVLYASAEKLVEKYDVLGSGTGGGGEYPLQDGFGWTNGVAIRLLDLYESGSGTPRE